VSKYRRGVAPDDLEKVVHELIEQLKILVVAVDDLRCEVEWWSRNGGETPFYVAASPPSTAPSTKVRAAHQEPVPAVAASAASREPSPSSLSAVELLRRLEESLMNGPTGAWLDPWPGEDAPDLPCGFVIEVDEDLWCAVLDFRPAHIVGASDDACEHDIGAPYLLAWRNEQGCYLRELSDEESLQLQRLCLETRSRDETPRPAVAVTTQQSLW
jgi:hypothetical protein